MKVRDIPLEKIFITKNVRFDTDEELGELMESTVHMLLQPAGVFPRLGDPRGDYELVWGHRRFRAAQMNNEATLACHILEGVSEADIPLLKLQENMVRKQLTTEEVLAAADEIKRRRPELTDRQIDKLLGKRPGYLGFRRSLQRAYSDLAARGISKDKLDALGGDEILELRARLEHVEKPTRKNKGSFHRGDRVPKAGYQVVNSKGPNIVVICASQAVKSRVLGVLRKARRTV
jgi:ParB-like chromosome segregation protein Spo0J